jgi:hypothetical protein
MHREEYEPLLSSAAEMRLHELGRDHLVAALAGDVIDTFLRQAHFTDQETHAITADVEACEQYGRMFIAVAAEQVAHQAL